MARSRKLLVLGARRGCGSGGFARPHRAQASRQQTPKGWNYEIKDGKRVPKAATA